ncbi:hypothetical protein 015DV004_227 [Bacillus phage 015DV004]|nr:hypothetical protein 015DV004_227 [Bacillus phage 015DV004]
MIYELTKMLLVNSSNERSLARMLKGQVIKNVETESMCNHLVLKIELEDDQYIQVYQKDESSFTVNTKLNRREFYTVSDTRYDVYETASMFTQELADKLSEELGETLYSLEEKIVELEDDMYQGYVIFENDQKWDIYVDYNYSAGFWDCTAVLDV